MDHKVVDGARGKWCPLLLLDAMVQLLNTRSWCFTSRRVFDQRKALADAVLDVLAESDWDFFCTLAAGTHSNLLDGLQTDDGWLIALACSNALPLQVTSLPYQWQSMEGFMGKCLTDLAGRARCRFLHILNCFCVHDRLNSYNLQEIVRLVVVRIIVYFACGRYVRAKHVQRTSIW